MALQITFNKREHKKFLQSWDKHFDELKHKYEPTFHVSSLKQTISPEKMPLLLTSWVNGEPVIMPPADIVSLIFYDHRTESFLTYLIAQPVLLEHLGWTLHPEPSPTLHFRIDALLPTVRDAILKEALYAGETPLASTHPQATSS